MTHDPDKLRWLDEHSETPEGMRELLRSAETDDGGGPEAAARVEALLGGLLDAPPPEGGGSAGSGGAGGGGALTRWMLGGGAVCVLGGLVTLGLMSAPEPTPEPPPAPRPALPAAAEAPKPPVEIAPPKPTTNAAPTSAPTPQPSSKPTPAVAPPASDAAPPQRVRNQKKRGKRKKPKPRDFLAEERALLDRAQAQLAQSPAKALELTDEHYRRFPQGALAQEREVLAVEALARLGRKGEARFRARRFEKRYPGSSHLDRLRDVTR